MGTSVFPAPNTSKTSYKLSLTSGTSWTVPSNVTQINVTLVGGGGGGAGSGTSSTAGGVGGTTTLTGATSAVGGNGCVNYFSVFTVQNGATGAASTPNTGKGGLSSIEYGGASSAGAAMTGYQPSRGEDGQIITSTLAVTPGNSITYSIGAGGTAGSGGTSGAAGQAGASGRIDIEYWA